MRIANEGETVALEKGASSVLRQEGSTTTRTKTQFNFYSKDGEWWRFSIFSLVGKWHTQIYGITFHKSIDWRGKHGNLFYFISIDWFNNWHDEAELVLCIRYCR